MVIGLHDAARASPLCRLERLVRFGRNEPVAAAGPVSHFPQFATLVISACVKRPSCAL